MNLELMEQMKLLEVLKNTEDSNIYYKIQDDKITKFVKSDSILVRTSDNFKLQVISVENKKVINGSLVVNGEQVPIALFTIVTKVYEKEKFLQL